MKKVMDQSKLINLLNGISLAALVAVVILLGVCISTSMSLESASEDRFNLTYNANRFMDGSAYLTQEVRAYAATGNQQYYNNYMNEVNILQNREQGLAAMQQIGITTDEQLMVDNMSTLSNQLVPLEEDALEMAREGRITSALSYVYGETYSATVRQIDTLRDQFLEALDLRTQKEVDKLEFRLVIINILCVVALLIASIMQIMTMVFTKKQILVPVLAVRDQMGEIAVGNLSAEFSLKADTSEIGMLVDSIHKTKRELKTYVNDIDNTLSQMAQGRMDVEVGNDYVGDFLPIQQAMRQILDSLNGALSRIGQTAERVTNESVRMTTDAQILADGAVEQASTVEELSASIQDLSGEVSRTAEDADSAWNCSSETGSKLRLCSQKMEEMTQAMFEISDSSKKINGIIQTIENISFQTNILALNAAVEAARAGAAGKGFAVVANEVQSLANRSASAAMDITKLIKNSLQQIEQGAALTVETTEVLANGVSGAEKSMELVERIAKSAKEQANALSQLTGGMEQISGVIQTTAATAETSATAAQSLQDQATELKDSVQRFRLRRAYGL